MTANTEHDALVEHIIKQAERELCEAAATITAQAAQIARLRDALQAASDHLDYCGYGDAWERECSEGLPEQIEAALTEGTNDAS